MCWRRRPGDWSGARWGRGLRVTIHIRFPLVFGFAKLKLSTRPLSQEVFF